MNSSQRPYQGYPYTNPPVTDAPTIDPETASRWTNLPRKQIHMPARKSEQPVVYINVPEDRPGTSAVVEEAETHTPSAAEPRLSLPAKKEIDETPVVYIDIETSGSDVAQSREEEAENDEPEFVQETIYYDPFEDRRIDTMDRSKAEGSDTASDVSSVRSHRGQLNRPVRPNILNLNAPGTSSYNCPSSNTSSIPSVSPTNLPPILSKETQIYGRTPPVEDFSISPIPVSSFPEPPPAYTEIDRVSNPIPPAEPPRPQPVATTPPPRTQVITHTGQNNSALPQGSPQVDHQIPIGMPNTDRKYLDCHHCGMRVHTLVIREVGSIAIIALLMCLVICLLPIVFLIYTTSCMKNKNHYCPNCNKLIAYELPFSDDVVYVN